MEGGLAAAQLAMPAPGEMSNVVPMPAKVKADSGGLLYISAANFSLAHTLLLIEKLSALQCIGNLRVAAAHAAVAAHMQAMCWLLKVRSL